MTLKSMSKSFKIQIQNSTEKVWVETNKSTTENSLIKSKRVKVFTKLYLTYGSMTTQRHWESY